MKTLEWILSLVLAWIVVGCAGQATNVTRQLNRQAKATGSPFRWKTESQGGHDVVTKVLADLPRGDTKADAPLKKEILSKIEQLEASKGRGAPEIAEICLMPDGREVWVIRNIRLGVAYLIGMDPSAQGGTDFTIAGPENFQRERKQ